MPVVSILISVGHNKKTTGLPVFFFVFFLLSSLPPTPPPPYMESCTCIIITVFPTLGTLTSQISWVWRKGGLGWGGVGFGRGVAVLAWHVDVACKDSSAFVWGSLARRLMCMSLFLLERKGKKIAPTETSASIPPPSHAFWPNHPRTENTFKKPPATQTNTPKIVERNTHTKIYWKIKYWLLIELHLILIMSSLLVMIVLIYVPERQVVR